MQFVTQVTSAVRENSLISRKQHQWERKMRIVATIAALLFAAAAAAQTQSQQSELKSAFTAAKATMEEGPADVKFADQAVLHLPKGYVFIPQNEAIRILKALGNKPAPDTIGAIFPAGDEPWFMVVRYVKSGYIKDDDARDWKADELLANITAATEEANKERHQRGIPEMQVLGWVEAPAYNTAMHRLVWSLSTKDKGAPAEQEKGVNYNTYVLGREGYVSMNLVTELGSVEALKPTAKSLIGHVDFEKGKSYEDFNAKTDHVAEYGLAALVGGIAAKKLGLLALIAAFFAKSIKLTVAIVLGGAAAVAKFFKRDKDA